MFYEWAKQRILLHDYAAHTKRQTRKDPYTGESYTEEKRVMNVWAHLLVGGVAGSVAQTVSYPFDTIRHRM